MATMPVDRFRTRVRALALAGLLALLAGCTPDAEPVTPADTPSAPAEPTPTPTPDRPLGPAVAPDAFTNRAPLPQCPPETLAAGAGLSDAGGECLYGGWFDGNGAEIAVTTATDGGTVITYYRTLPPGPGLEFFATLEASAAWTLTTCPDALSVELLGTCTTAQF